MYPCLFWFITHPKLIINTFIRQRRNINPPSLTSEELADVITEIRQLWPECRMVRGSPRHSESNGGVERVNRTVQAKLGTWMQDTNSRRWSVGCRIVMWRYNTQQHRTLDDIPYRLMFGQLPRVGISSLHIDPALLETLATETELNQLVDLPPIDEQIMNIVLQEDEAVEAEAMMNGNELQEDGGIVAPGVVDAAVDVDVLEDDDDDPDSSSFTTAVINEEDVMSSTNRDLFGAAFGSGGASASTTTPATATATKTNTMSSNYDSDEDDNCTLDDLGRRAAAVGNFKTTGDDDYTAWQVLRSELSDSVVVDCNYLQGRKLREKVPIAYCTDTRNIHKQEAFIPAILVRVTKNKWELMNENDDQMEQMEWDGDNGIGNLVGTYIKHADKAFCAYFKSLDNCEKQAAHDDSNEVTPRRGALRKRAHEKLSKSALSMKKRVLDRVGEDKVCEVGEVVHVPLKDMDKAKVDTGNLTGVIVQVDKARSQARVAVKSGMLKSWYVYHRLGHITGAGNNVELCGLSDALASWKKMKVITEREAARNESMVGGQGKGDVTCNCKGQCNTNQCSCKKAGRICTSACHRNNFNCVNHDRGEE